MSRTKNNNNNKLDAIDERISNGLGASGVIALFPLFSNHSVGERERERERDNWNSLVLLLLWLSTAAASKILYGKQCNA